MTHRPTIVTDDRHPTDVTTPDGRHWWVRLAAWLTLDRVTDLAITVGLGVLLAVGFAASYTTLLELAVTKGGYPTWLAPAVPLAFDLGIVVLSLKVVRSAREGRTAPILRCLVAALSVATVAVNAAAASGVAGAVLHAVPPAMFVVAFESVIASTRRHALERRGLVPPALPRVRGVRWLLAPSSTFKAWRKAVLKRDLFEDVVTIRPAVVTVVAETPVTPSAPRQVTTRRSSPSPKTVPSRPTGDDRQMTRRQIVATLVAEGIPVSSADVQKDTRWTVSEPTARRIRDDVLAGLAEIVTTEADSATTPATQEA